MFKRITAFLLASVMILSSIIQVHAEEIEINFIQNSKIDIILTSKDYNFDSDKFKNDIIERLSEKGLDVNLIDVQTIETSQFDMNSSDAKTIINKWMKFPQNKASNWSYNSGGYITSSVNEPYETGFINTTEGYVQNVTLDGRLYTNEYTQPMGYIIRMKPQDNNPNRWNMYMLWVSGWDGYKYSNQNPNSTTAAGRSYDTVKQRSIVLFKVEGLYIDYNYWKNVTTGGTYAATPLCQTKYAEKTVLGWPYHGPRAYGGYPDGTPLVNGTTVVNSGDKGLKTTTLGWCNIPLGNNEQFNLKIEAKGDTMKVYYNDSLQFSAVDDSYSEGYYGLFEFSHVSPRFYGINATTENFKEFNDILLAPSWREDADHYIVNVDNKIDKSFTDNKTKGEILTRTLNDNIDFIQWGSDENESVMKSFIKQNNGNGTFIEGNDYEKAINETIDYIVQKYTIAQNVEQTVLVNSSIDISVTPESYKSNTKNVEYPNGKWIIHHDYTYFDNNLGQYENADVYLDAIPNNIVFDKTGKYEICFGDEVAQCIYVHRKPIASFDAVLNKDKTVTLTSTSYDLDVNNSNNGIVEEKWQYKEINDEDWTTGKPNNALVTGKTYAFQLQVKDEQGVWSAPASKFITLDNDIKLQPVAQFNFKENEIFTNNELVINDTSYDPAGKNITKKEWTLKKDSVKISTSSVPTTDFSSLGVGHYSYSLQVTNSDGTVSEIYTKSFDVLVDNKAPIITIDPTFCDWKESQDIHIKVEDSDSGLNKWRYCYTQNQNSPEESQWKSWQTNEEETLTFNTDGEYYLHIQAIDNVGNSIERTAGLYKITHPYTNKIVHHYNGIETVEFKTYDWGKWYSPVEQFKKDINGFEISDNNLISYPTAGTKLASTERIKQPSNDINFDFYYEPIEYKITYDYNLEDVESVENPSTYTVLDSVKFNNPKKEGYEFIGWYLNNEIVYGINTDISNDFENFDDFVNEMKLRKSGNIILVAKWNQTQFIEGTNVFATIASDYKITIPKTIVLSGITKSANYYVKVEGDIAGYEQIEVIPDEKFSLNTPNKNNVIAVIEQDKTTWKYDNFDINANGIIKADDITAGKWMGIFNFNINFNGDNEPSSEELIEYKTIEYPQN